MTSGNLDGHGGSSAVFTDCTGQQTRAALRRLSWHRAVFEVYGGLPPMRLSEVLAQLRVVLNGVPVYEGGAVVNSVVDTGTGYICEVALDPAGLDRARVGGNGRLQNAVREGLSAFGHRWPPSKCGWSKVRTIG